MVAGLRVAPVLLTRPAGRNTALAVALRQAGLNPVEAPALLIQRLETPRPMPRAGDLFVFVSGQAVAAYFEERAAAWPAGAWAAAVGAATATALQAHVPADRILAPEAGQPADSESLWRIIEAHALRAGQAHILRADRGRDWLAQQLRQGGWRVDCHALYRRTPQAWSRALCDCLCQQADAILLVTSLEALSAIEDSLRREGLSWPPALRAVTLHERIGRRLQYLYAAQPNTALRLTLSSPDEAALFQAIVAASRQPS